MPRADEPPAQDTRGVTYLQQRRIDRARSAAAAALAMLGGCAALGVSVALVVAVLAPLQAPNAPACATPTGGTWQSQDCHPDRWINPVARAATDAAKAHPAGGFK